MISEIQKKALIYRTTLWLLKECPRHRLLLVLTISHLASVWEQLAVWGEHSCETLSTKGVWLFLLGTAGMFFSSWYIVKIASITPLPLHTSYTKSGLRHWLVLTNGIITHLAKAETWKLSTHSGTSLSALGKPANAAMWISLGWPSLDTWPVRALTPATYTNF